MTAVIQEARVVAKKADRVWVQACIEQGCSSCHLSSSCGQGLLARWFSRPPPLLQLDAPNLVLEVGDRVELGVDASILNRAAWLQFALPLMTLLLASIFAEFLGVTSVFMQLVVAILGLAVGLLGARKFAGQATKPELLRKVTT
ncbi:positive regulator of sigma(E), RseC/MucC [Marinospirillum celere]|uniref:Positive regulator of sigma(E), RseC/MucC n=1 Tax=Marinospirillum celere TaxID=1122252 RepID=A0A1I1G042_9GAMM|nr:SoxR reducing system RseC family protein [Marinospirillum celere]SFC02673.1 positive regulator of sigma(E), RseC/MucC [Marinospirillum celere]